MLKKLTKQQIIIILGSFLLLIAVIVGVIIYQNSLATLNILVAPASSKITINNKTYSNGEYKLPAGDYKAKIEKDGFYSKEVDLKLNSGELSKLYIYLDQTDGSYSWYLKHPDDDMLRTEIGDYEADNEAKEYTKKYPITQILPLVYAHYDEEYNYTEYQVDGGSFEECKQDFCLKITDTTGGNEENAKNLIKENGYNPEDFEIIYEYVPIEELE